MSALLRDVRLQLVHELGVKMDDALETAKADSIRREGAHAAYANAARNMRALFTQAEKEHAEGKLSDSEYELARSWIKRSVAACDSLTTQAFPLMHAAKGAERQAATTVAMLKQVYDLEEMKKQRESVPVPAAAPAPATAAEPVSKTEATAAVAAEPAKRPHARPRTIKEERLAAAAARKAEEEAAAAAAAAAEAAKKTAPKKRGRRARNA